MIHSISIPFQNGRGTADLGFSDLLVVSILVYYKISMDNVLCDNMF